MASQSNEPKTRLGRFIFGALFVVAGLFPMLASFDVGPLGARDIAGPAWMGFAAGGIFVAGGLAVIANKSPLASVFTLLVLVGFAAIGNWIAFGAGERICSSSFSIFGFGGDSDSSGLGCRIPFGFGAVMVDAILFYASVSILQKALGGPPALARTLKVGEWAIWVSVSPLLLIMLIILITRTGYDVLKTRVKTGVWPRNESFIQRQREKGLLSGIGRQRTQPESKD